MENYFFDTEDFPGKGLHYYVLVIYDIVDNRKRVKIAKLMQSFGFRVQKSAFEARLAESKYNKMMAALHKYIAPEDSVRVYKIRGTAAVTVMGADDTPEIEDVIII